MTARGTLPVSPLNRREWAEAYLELRLKPIPLDGKTPQIRWRQFKTRVPRPDEIVESFDDARVDSPSRNIGLVMRGTGLVVVDCDGPNAPDLLIEHGIDLDRFPHHVTGSGNPCYWARTDVALRDRVALLTDGRTRANGGSQVDIKADGVVTVPPSVHPDTRRAYVWKSPFQNVSDVPLLPTRLLELIERHNPPGEVVSDGSIPEGQRHDCLLRMLGAARRHGADEASLMALAKAVNRRCTPELPPSELRVMVQSLLRYPPESRPNISPPVSFRSASDICAEVPEGLDFIVAPYLVGGAIADLHGSPKIGKTTIRNQWISCAVNGAAFLDYPVYPPTPVVLLTEEPLNALNEGLQAFGLAKSADLLVATLADVGERRWSQVVASATDLAVKINSRLMVVDTLPAFVGLGGDSENSAGTALAAMRPLQDAAARGVAVLICRHDRKSGGDVTARARGSSAYSGAVDVTISLRKPSRTQDRFRTLEAVGRFRSVPSLVTVELVSFHATPPGSGVVTTIPSETFRRVSAADDPSEDTTTAILLASLPTNEDEAIALTALSEHSGVPESSLRRSLNVLADQGRRGRIGTGTKGDPFRFYLLSPTLNPGVGVDDKKLDRRVTGPRR